MILLLSSFEAQNFQKKISNVAPPGGTWSRVHILDKKHSFRRDLNPGPCGLPQRYNRCPRFEKSWFKLSQGLCGWNKGSKSLWGFMIFWFIVISELLPQHGFSKDLSDSGSFIPAKGLKNSKIL